MARRRNAERERQIISEYENGTSPLEITMKYGIAQNTVWYILVRNGIERNQRKGAKQNGKYEA